MREVLALVIGALLGEALCWREARALDKDPRSRGRSRKVACAAALGLVFVALVWRFGLGLEFLQLAIFSSSLLYVCLTDLDERRIPNAAVLVALVVRLGYLGFQWATGAMGAVQVLSYLLSALVVGVVLVAIVVACDRMLGRASMGGGDLKLFLLAALYFGFLQTIFLVLFACVLGIASSVLFRDGVDNKNVDDALEGVGAFPFAPAIALACVVTMLFGENVAALYLAL